MDGAHTHFLSTIIQPDIWSCSLQQQLMRSICCEGHLQFQSQLPSALRAGAKDLPRKGAKENIWHPWWVLHWWNSNWKHCQRYWLTHKSLYPTPSPEMDVNMHNRLIPCLHQNLYCDCHHLSGFKCCIYCWKGWQSFTKGFSNNSNILQTMVFLLVFWQSWCSPCSHPQRLTHMSGNPSICYVFRKLLNNLRCFFCTIWT